MGWMTRVWFLAGAGNFFLSCHIQARSGAHPASCLMGTGGSYTRGKVAKA